MFDSPLARFVMLPKGDGCSATKGIELDVDLCCDACAVDLGCATCDVDLGCAACDVDLGCTACDVDLCCAACDWTTTAGFCHRIWEMPFEALAKKGVAKEGVDKMDTASANTSPS